MFSIMRLDALQENIKANPVVVPIEDVFGDKSSNIYYSKKD